MLISKRKTELKKLDIPQETYESVYNTDEKHSDYTGNPSLFIYGEAEPYSKESYEPSLSGIENFLFIEYRWLNYINLKFLFSC